METALTVASSGALAQIGSIEIREARDLLSAIPYLVGYRPADCLLVVCIQEGGSIGLIARTALRDLIRDSQRVKSAQLIARRAAEDATTYAYIVIYSSANVRYDALAHSFQAILGAQHIAAESWLVGSATFRNLDCRDENCCPRGGYRVQLLESTEIGAQLVWDGVAPAASRADAYGIRMADESLRRRARKAARSAQQRRLEAVAAGPEALSQWRSNCLADWHRVIAASAGGEVDPSCVGRLAVALGDVMVRDAVLLATLPGGTEVAEATALGADPDQQREGVKEVLGALLTPELAVPPELAELAGPIRVLEATVAMATRSGRVAPLTLLAILNWWVGDGGRAGHRLADALRIDPNYRLASVFGQVIDSGMPAGWLVPGAKLAENALINWRRANRL